MGSDMINEPALLAQVLRGDEVSMKMRCCSTSSKEASMIYWRAILIFAPRGFMGS